MDDPKTQTNNVVVAVLSTSLDSKDVERTANHSESSDTPRPQADDDGADGIQFDGPNDPRNPINWSARYKISMTFLISVISLVANMGILLSAPFAPTILKEFGDDSKSEAVLLVSIWELGEVISPLFMGPLSELCGRRLVYNCANICFVAVSCGAALSYDTGMLIAFRFLSGLTIASTTLNSCIVGDMFKQEQRGRALSWLGMMPYIGPVLGPVVGGYVSQSIGWRWTFWITAIAMGLLEAVFLFTFRECYAPFVIRTHQRRLERQQRQQESFHIGFSTLVFSKFEMKLSLRFLGRALYRPFKILLTSPVVILVSLNWILASAYLHLLFNTMNFVYEDIYHFAPGPVGLAYLGLGLGMIMTAFVCSQTLDRYLKRRKRSRSYFRAEDRLPPVLVGNVLLCVGMIWFGWAVHGHTHWIVPILASSLFGASFVATSIGIQSYIVDCFSTHAASALAGAIAVRNTAATVVPLAGPRLWAKLGYGIGGTALAAIGLAFLPIPIVLLKYGEQLQRHHRIHVH